MGVRTFLLTRITLVVARYVMAVINGGKITENDHRRSNNDAAVDIFTLKNN